MTDYRQAAHRATATFEYDDEALGNYQPIENFGAIGNARTNALIGPNGALEWACFPRPDSPPVFFSLLDRNRGGVFIIRPVDRPFVSRQMYEHETNVLRTEFYSERGIVRLTDMMPYWGDDRIRMHEIHRRLVCLAGEMELEIIYRPRFGWDGEPAHLRRTKYGVLALSGEGDHLGLFGRPRFAVDEDTGEARARIKLGMGEGLWLVCAWDSGNENVEAFRSSELLERTRRYWRRWVNRCTYQGSWRSEVVRSALAMKLLFYEPTGAMIAAATTSLPESIGGERNWDYRYTWIRDSAYTLAALFRLGYVDEAIRFAHWLEGSVSRSPDKLRLMYSITGDCDGALDEQILTHLEGYEGSQPVRIGNGAATQIQSDIFGAMLQAAWLLHANDGVITMRMWRQLRRAINAVCRTWRQPDHGLWEARVAPRHYTYSKMQCWVALDRGLRLADELGGQALYNLWTENKKRLAKQLLDEGYDERLGAFVQTYGSNDLDASVLTFSKWGLVAPDDPRMLSTIDRIRKDLADGPYVWRYKNADGLQGDEGAFLLCSFWLVEALAKSGQLADAADLHRQLLGTANHLGLLAEEYDPRAKRQLGNFPQAFSHLGVLNATLAIHEAMGREEHGQAMSWLGRTGDD